MKIFRLTCCLFVLLLSLVAFTFSPSAQASVPQSGGGGGVGNCVESGVTVCSITVASTGKLIARTTVLISATATCTVPTGFTFQGGFGEVGITQASGRQITQAFGNFNLTTCDGTAQTFQVAVTPQVGLPPFHGGPATATGALFVNDLDAFGNPIQEQAFTGPQVIHITG
jgi:hypothetical protein